MCDVNITDILNLTDRWESMNLDVLDNTFDYHVFRNLAADTFKNIFPYHSERTIPKELLELMLSVSKFANCMIGGISEECDAAQLVANEFCNQLADCWVCADDGVSEKVFIVADENGCDHYIDTETFDLSELID